MQRSLDSKVFLTIALAISLVLHALGIVAVILIAGPGQTPLPTTTPVRIVNLPPDVTKRLPPVQQPVPREVSPPLGTRDVLRLPRTAPMPKFGTGKEGRSMPVPSIPGAEKGGPLPFLSQQDINELARKGYTHDELRNDALDQETEAFKFLPYGRSLVARLQKNARYPELAGITGLQGDVYVNFEIKKDGSLGNIDLEKSSGYKILDDAVIEMIQVSAPFQPLPPEWHKERIIIPLVATFRIYYVLVR